MVHSPNLFNFGRTATIYFEKCSDLKEVTLNLILCVRFKTFLTIFRVIRRCFINFIAQ